MKGRDIVLSIGGCEVKGFHIKPKQSGECKHEREISCTVKVDEVERQDFREFIDRIKNSVVDISQGFSMNEYKLFEVSND